MPTTISAARLRQMVTAYLALVASVTLLFALLNARAAHPWIMGEWLINYSGGFIRRGLLGELLLLVHDGVGLPLLGLASALQILIYSLFYLSLLPLLRGLRWSLPLLALLLSPATLAFTVLDPPTSVRKEALLFLALSLLANALVSWRPRPWQIAAALTVVGPSLVLAHEALLAFLPWLAVPLLLLGRRPGPLLRLFLAPTLLTLAAFVAVVRHPGTAAQVQTICSAVHGSFFPSPGGLCTGAIAYLRMTPAAAHADAFRAMRFYGYGGRYTVPCLLTFLPVVFVVRERLRRGLRRSTTLLLAAGAISLLASLPLFFFARDWGRWLEIHATCLLILLLLLERSTWAAFPGEAATNDPQGGGEAGIQLPAPRRAAAAALLALALYSCCWTLPAVGIFPGRYGYIDLARYLLSYRSKPHLPSGSLPMPTSAPQPVQPR